MHFWGERSGSEGKVLEKNVESMVIPLCSCGCKGNIPILSFEKGVRDVQICTQPRLRFRASARLPENSERGEFNWGVYTKPSC